MNRKPAWIGGAVLAAVVGAAIAVTVVTSYTDGARPGAAYPGIGTIDSRHDREVILPIGTLKVRFGSPSQEYEVDYAETHRAADGAVLVPVTWQLAGSQLGVGNSVPVYQFQLALVADGRRYDLQAGREDEPAATPPAVVTSGGVAVVVEGDGSDLELEVAYDGLTQVLDVESGKVDAGLAAPFYAPGGLKTLLADFRCTALPPADRRAVSLGLDKCSVGPLELTPYVGGLGWVDSADESWATVRYSLQVAGVRSVGDGTQYSTGPGRMDITLDGAKPTADILSYRDEISVLLTGIKVFRTSPTPRTLGVTTEIRADGTYFDKGVRILRNVLTVQLP